MTKILEEVKKLNKDEKLKLYDYLLAEVDLTDESFELTEEEKSELDKRTEYYRLHPESLIPWEDIKKKYAK